MANTVIQIKRSVINDIPTTLNIAEPAYSYTSNTLFIGSSDNTNPVAIGGKFYLDQQQVIYNRTNAAFNIANTNLSSVYGAFNHANGAFVAANTAETKALSAGVYANNAFVAANSSGVYANSAFAAANSAGIYANGAFVAANTAETKALSAGVYANASFVAANSAGAYANSAFAAANSAGIYANGAFTAANTSETKALSAGVYANSAFAVANIAGPINVTQNTSIAAAFTRANNSINANSGGTITGSLTVTGNLTANLTGGSITGLSAAIAISDGGTNGSSFTPNQITYFNGTSIVSLSNTGIAGTYGNAAYHPIVTTDAYGRVSGVTNTPIQISATQVTSGLTTGNNVIFNGSSLVSQANIAAINSSITANNTVNNITTDSYGRVIGYTTQAISGLALSQGGTGADTAAGVRTALGLGTAAELNAGAANGVAGLDSAGTVPIAQLPAAVLGAVNYQGTWNASTNTPTLASSVGTKGYYYVVSVVGSTNLNGITDWKIGDWAIYSGTAWQKIDNTDAVQSVNGYTGAVVLTYTDVGAQVAGTYVTSVAGTAPVVSSGGTTPAISMAAATSSVNGYLTSIDWSTFNGKQASGAYLTTVTADAPLAGLGTSASHLSMPAATTSVSGYLTSTDWATFNAKQASFGSQTANYVYAAPNGSAGVPSFRALVAVDVPTLNQNTTGTASNVTGTVAIANGGTGSSTAATARTTLGLGTISTQDASSVAITGGAVNGTTVGSTTTAAAAFTTLAASGMATLTAGAEVQGLTVGRGAGAIAYNTAVGASALVSNTTGANNTAIGYAALTSNTTGNNNTASGFTALYNNTTGGNNTALGNNTGLGITTGSGNTILGANVTGLAAALTNNIIIANGTGAIKAQHDGAEWTLTGKTKLNAGAEVQGHVLGIGSGGQSSNVVFGASALRVNSTGSGNTGLGYQVLFSNTTGYNNTIVGVNAFYVNTTGNNNTAYGANALQNNTTASENSGFGVNALYYNTTGFQNTGFGSYSLYLNTTGSYNTASGRNSLSSNTTGSYNASNGESALYTNTTGTYNVGMGYNTGRGITTGSGNTIVGAQVIGLAAALTNNIILANGTGAIKAQHDGTYWAFTGPIRASGYTVATLPTGVQGMRAFVTDALTPAYLALAVGGGMIVAPVFYNGTQWVTA